MQRSLLHIVGWLVRMAVGLAVLIAGGCAQDQPRLAAPATAGAHSAAHVATSALQVRIDRNDKIRVTVFNEPQLSGEFLVEGGGTVAYPLLGQIAVAGLTAREAEQALTGRLKGRYLVNPRVTVEIVSQRPIYILGEVTRSGEYPYRPGMNVVAAVALAGGFTPRASTAAIKIRRSATGEEQQVPVTPDIPVYPGDLITVSERYF